MFVTAGN